MLEGIGISLPLLVAFLVNFVILFVLLGLVLYKPVLKMLDERAARIKESLEQVERMKQQAASAEDKVKAQIEAGRKEAQAIVAQAVQAGQKLKVEATEAARKEAEAVIARARLEIQRERDETTDQLRKEFVDIAIKAAEKVISETLDREKHRRVIEKVLEESSGLKKD